MAITGEHGAGHRTQNSASHNMGGGRELSPHDPYRMLACALFAQAVRDYSATYPRDTGSTAVDTRRKNWLLHKTSAEWFLFKDVDYMGKFHIFCTLVKINPNTARKLLLENKHRLKAVCEELFYATRKTTNGLDTTNDK